MLHHCPEAHFQHLKYDDAKCGYSADVRLEYDDVDHTHHSVYFECRAAVPKETPLAAIQVALLQHAERQSRLIPEYQKMTKDLSEREIVVP